MTTGKLGQTQTFDQLFSISERNVANPDLGVKHAEGETKIEEVEKLPDQMEDESAIGGLEKVVQGMVDLRRLFLKRKFNVKSVQSIQKGLSYLEFVSVVQSQVNIRSKLSLKLELAIKTII